MILLEIEAFLLSHSRSLKFYALLEISNEDRAFIDNFKINEESQYDLAELRSNILNDFGDNRASLNSKHREFGGHVINCLKRQKQCCGFYVEEAELGIHMRLIFCLREPDHWKKILSLLHWLLHLAEFRQLN